MELTIQIEIFLREIVGGKINLIRPSQHRYQHFWSVIDELSYDTRNDKAFAVNGRVTHPYMTGDVLTKPRITKAQIKEIILGGGQNLLSPERRFDAIIFNCPDIFD